MVEKKDPFDEFLFVWETFIKKIEETPMNSSELNHIMQVYMSSANFFDSLSKSENKNSDRYWHNKKRYILLLDKLTIAASISLSKWKDKHPGFHELFFSKLKNINIGINLPDIK